MLLIYILLKIAQKGKTLFEVARSPKSCSKSQKLSKRCRAQSGQAHTQCNTVFVHGLKLKLKSKLSLDRNSVIVYLRKKSTCHMVI